MNRKRMLAVGLTALVLAGGALAVFRAKVVSAQDKYTVSVPGGLAFAEFRGYENWQLVSISQNGSLMAAILGNPIVIDAFRSGIPGNGKPFPDGSKMAKIHWVPRQNTDAPGPPTVPSVQHDADFMVKDSKRFPDADGWGFGSFQYDAASDTFSPSTTANKPPQGNDAKCGVVCHTQAKARDFVFTEYARR
ncbi:MAG TPA: cytochrome P460 family protein [Polyangia bacterium]|nr:cytochrome P460 family protein [Polyangia bacterium]